RPRTQVRLAAAVVLRTGDRRAEDLLRRREHFDAAAAGADPRLVLFGHAADGDDPLDFGAEDRGEAVDHAAAAAAAVDVVAGDDEEEALAVRIGIAVHVDAADHEIGRA